MGITIGTLNLLNPAFALEPPSKKIKTNVTRQFESRIIETANFFSQTLSLDIICLQETRKFSANEQKKLKQFKIVENGLNDGLTILYNNDKFESRKYETYQLADENLKVLLLDLEEKTTKKVIRIAHCCFKDANNQNIPFDELLQRMDHNPVRAENEPQEHQQDPRAPVNVKHPLLNEQPIEIRQNQNDSVKLLKNRAKGPKRRLPTRKQGDNGAMAEPPHQRPVKIKQRQRVNNIETAPQYAIQSQVIIFDYKSKAPQDFNAKFAPLTNANYKSNYDALPAEASFIQGIWVKNQPNLPSVNTTMPFSDKMKLYSVTILPVNEPAQEPPIENDALAQVRNVKIDTDLKKVQETAPQKKMSLLRRLFACLLRVFSCCYSKKKVQTT